MDHDDHERLERIENALLTLFDKVDTMSAAQDRIAADLKTISDKQQNVADDVKAIAAKLADVAAGSPAAIEAQLTPLADQLDTIAAAAQKLSDAADAAAGKVAVTPITPGTPATPSAGDPSTVASVVIANKALALRSGAAGGFAVAYLDKAGAPVAGITPVVTSDSPNVTINADGSLHAAAVGTARITYTVNKLSDTGVVTVT